MNERPYFCDRRPREREDLVREEPEDGRHTDRCDEPPLPLKRTSPSRIPRRSIAAGAAGSGTRVLISDAVDLLDLLEGERLHLDRQRLEQQRLAEGLAAGDGPVDHLPQLGRLRRTGRDDHVGERRDRVRERVALRRVDDRERAVPGDLLRKRVSCGLDPAEAGRRELAGGVLDRGEAQLVRQRVGDVDVAERALRLRDAPLRRRSCRGHRPRRATAD